MKRITTVALLWAAMGAATAAGLAVQEINSQGLGGRQLRGQPTVPPRAEQRHAGRLSYAGSSSLGVVSINSRGEAAGSAVRPGAFAPDGDTALLWPANAASPLDLNAGARFAPGSAWNVHATDINEAGTVLAGYNDTGGNFFTFLLQPLP